jgi:hypothetical protein
MLIGGAIALVTVVVAAALYVLGSPGEQRRLRLDERRVEDLNALRADIGAYWRVNRRLPASLGEASRDPALYRDPVSGDAYEYRVLGERSYELCATFERPYSPDRPQLATRFWPHPAGRHCFALDVPVRDQPRF